VANAQTKQNARRCGDNPRAESRMTCGSATPVANTTVANLSSNGSRSTKHRSFFYAVDSTNDAVVLIYEMASSV